MILTTRKRNPKSPSFPKLGKDGQGIRDALLQGGMRYAATVSVAVNSSSQTLPLPEQEGKRQLSMREGAQLHSPSVRAQRGRAGVSCSHLGTDSGNFSSSAEVVHFPVFLTAIIPVAK